jgi:DNA-3-methyladenine glycosylase II
MISRLDKKSYADGLRILARRDRRLASIINHYGPAPMWVRKPGFSTLVYIILEQQVSLASAKAAFTRLVGKMESVTPEKFLSLSAPTLKTIGFSRQKMGYCRGLARSIVDGHLDLRVVGRMSDDDARRELIAHKGIGPWTADIYLLMALKRSDVWPASDLALIVGAAEALHLDQRPTREKLETIGEKWRPWRSIAARLLWHYYLSTRGENPSQSM